LDTLNALAERKLGPAPKNVPVKANLEKISFINPLRIFGILSWGSMA
jgi:hypothetical protein